jgi:MoxR-like ATPase
VTTDQTGTAASGGTATGTAHSAPTLPGDGDVDSLVQTAARIRQSIETVIEGKSEVVRTALTVLLAEGHLLIEDVPGVGKTMLAKTLARSLDCTVRRIQFTPDLLPGDVTGVSIFNQESRDFEFRPGAVFANIVLGDEINRASPKTQSALLECMEERQVTVDGTTYELASPFMVIATQNPVEMEGTYPLPEAQRDRFMARVSMGYPDTRAEMDMLAEHASTNPLDLLTAVADAALIARLVDVVRTIHVADSIRQYAVDISNATRQHGDVRLGASPRATLHLVRAAKAFAALDARDHVLPDDIQTLVPSVLAHRLILTADAQIAGRTPETVLTDILRRVPVPASARV